MTAVTARAHPNIALVKYWGKADTALNLPATGSLSMTLDVFPTTTTVTLAPDAAHDEVVLNGAVRAGVVRDRVVRFLDIVREMAGSRTAAVVDSVNTVPSAAGLASSASGFAALAAAASRAYGLDLDRTALSRLARRGSGSAARSVIPGFAVWHAGSDEESFAEPLDAPDLAMVIAIVNSEEKAVSSRDAMKRTALTSPFYPRGSRRRRRRCRPRCRPAVTATSSVSGGSPRRTRSACTRSSSRAIRPCGTCRR